MAINTILELELGGPRKVLLDTDGEPVCEVWVNGPYTELRDGRQYRFIKLGSAWPGVDGTVIYLDDEPDEGVK